MQINNWNVNRISKKTEKAVLLRLIQDLKVDESRFSFLEGLYNSELSKNNEFRSFLVQPSFSDGDLLSISKFKGVSLREINPSLTSYSEMLNSGKIYELSNDSLVNKIVEYYRTLNDFEIDVSDNEKIYSAFWNGRDLIEFWHLKAANDDVIKLRKRADYLLHKREGDDYKHLVFSINRGERLVSREIRRLGRIKIQNIDLVSSINDFLKQSK